jgi:hypothetical protein
MPRPSDRSDEHEYERRNPGASADPPQATGKRGTVAKKHDAALPGSQNADLKGARRDRTLRGATT